MLPVGFLTPGSAPDFDPVKDAFDLRSALKSTTNTKTIIKIICGRTNEQRQQIQQQFKKSKSELIQDIKSHTSGNFQKLLVGLLLPIVDFYCQELNDAKKGVFIDTLCTLSNAEIRTIKAQYEIKFSAPLESKIKSETSGNFRKLLLSLCTAARDESAQTNPAAAKEDAKQLLKAGELRLGTDEKTFIRILTERNYHQLNLIFQEYINQRKHSLKIGIEKEFSGDIKEALLAIYQSVTNKPEFFATRLHKSMVGLGTKDNQLIRVIIMRFQIDMKDIKTAFEGLYKKSLKSWIEGDTSGDYRQALLTLIGETK